jgi:hypothetical protein
MEVPMRGFRRLFFAGLAICAAGAAQAQPALSPGGPEIWDLRDPAQPRHWFTGFRCWDSAEGALYEGHTAFEAIGGDVACNYQSGDVAATLYVTLRRPLGASFDSVVTPTHQEVRARYSGARVLADRRRTIETAAGAALVDELVFAVAGRDQQQNSAMRGVTGVWHVDVAGWTLKLRLSNYAGGDLAWARRIAEALLARAFADMETARACANAGAAPAPSPNLTAEENSSLTAMHAITSLMLQGAMPSDPLAARAQGYVCLGEGLRAANGVLVTAMMQRPDVTPTAPAPIADNGVARLLAIGEIRDEATPATMIGIFELSLNPFGMPDVRNDPLHLAFTFNPTTTGFIGPIDASPPRLAAAQAAAYIAAGGLPRVMTTLGPATD